MLKKALSNLNAIQRVFVFFPIVFIVTTLVLKGFNPNFPEGIGGFIYVFGRSLGMEFEFSSLQSIYADIVGFSIIISCIIGFSFKTKEAFEIKGKN